jgi:hypothetical protein
MLNKFTPEQAAEIIAQSRATLARPFVPTCESERREDRQAVDDPPVDHAPRVESRMDRDRRELVEQEERFARERRRVDREEHNLEARLMAAVEARITAARAELRADMIEIAQAASTAVEAIGTAIDELRDTVKGPDVVQQVDNMFKNLERRLDEVLPRRAEIVDLPNPLVRRVN